MGSSKAWVRVLGIGPGMDGLINEWDALQLNDYKLKFRYPTDKEKQELWLINKELSGSKRAKYKKLEMQQDLLLQAAERGEIDVDHMINELQKFKKPHTKK